MESLTRPPLDKVREKRRELKTFNVRGFHEGCDGEWFAQHGISNSFETSWMHRCDKCGAIEHFDRRYPRIEHE